MAKKRQTFFGIFLEIIILIIFVKPMFNLNFFTGIFYILAILGAFWKKILFRKKSISWMIILGTFLSYLAGKLLPHLVGSYLAGDITSAVIIGLIMIYIWTKAKKLKKGKK